MLPFPLFVQCFSFSKNAKAHLEKAGLLACISAWRFVRGRALTWTTHEPAPCHWPPPPTQSRFCGTGQFALLQMLKLTCYSTSELVCSNGRPWALASVGYA